MTLGIAAPHVREQRPEDERLDRATTEHTPHQRVTLDQEVARLRAAAEQARHQLNLAEAAVAARDRFLAVAAHELRGPLSRLVMVLEQAQTDLAKLERNGAVGTRRVLTVLARAETQTDRLSRLVANLLDVSRLSADKLVLERAPTNLVALVAEQVAFARRWTPRHRLKLVAPKQLWIVADSLRLEEVLVNLLDNAMKFSPTGSTITVQLDVPEDATVRLQVIDQGAGIPPDQRPHIFDPAHQAHHLDQRSGLGLGLYVSREIVERHGGTITADCPPAGGTIMTVCLPVGTGLTGSEGKPMGTAVARRRWLAAQAQTRPK